ncbi:MAG: DUF839 domain-containing protein [Planctomycetota bacterium]
MKHTLPLLAALVAAGAQSQALAQTRQIVPPAQNLVSQPNPLAQALLTDEDSMMGTTTAATNAGWTATPLLTVSESVAGYQPVGLFDGLGAFPMGGKRARILVNHELGAGSGAPYTLANGTTLTGARMSQFVVRRHKQGHGHHHGGGANQSQWRTSVQSGGLAFDTIYDRAGVIVTDPAQINETGNAIDGFSRFCSATSVLGGTYGFFDDIFFTGEESSVPFHPHGGSIWALDVDHETLWAVPALGRGAWENVCPLSTGNPDTVALLCGDDTSGAPLYLYVGQKNAIGDASFLDRNGLAVGTVYAWRATSGDLDPESFHGVNQARSGEWVELENQNVGLAGTAGYDAQGYANSDTLQAQADSFGCFSFSRPEDLSVNPLDGTQAVFASTGRGSAYPSDNWGTLYAVDVDFQNMTADLVILHDADGLVIPDAGIRSPDNVCWSGNGKIYVQEDKSTSPGSLFGGATGIEASVWQLDPVTRAFTRIGEIDRSVVAPAGTTDSGVGSIGHWESSGVLDVTEFFETAPGGAPP